MQIEQFYLGGLGHQSYLVVDEQNHTAAVVDPRRDIAVYLNAAQRAEAHITHVFETHVHNDYVTGARELADRVGAEIVSAAAAGLLYDHHAVNDGDRVAVGTLTFETLATPGHTPAHVSYAVYEKGADKPGVVFSGGSMMVGGAGRTDLVSPGMTLTLTREQYRSLRRLLETLPADARVYPTHGAGSFCGATQSVGAARHTTIGQERLSSPAAHTDEVSFVQQQLAGYGVYPRYYVYMHDINQRGPRVLGDLPTPPPLSPQTVQAQMRDGAPLVDGRGRDAFASEHVPSSFNIELDEDFGTYVGWLLPFNAPLLLQMEDADGRREAVTQLMRIGFEQVSGYLDGGIPAWKAAGYPVESFERISVDDLYTRWRGRDRHNDPLAVLDVRDDQEWADGHIPGAQHIHIGDLLRHLHAVPASAPVAVICASGFRAEIGASILSATGRQVLAVQGGVPDWIAKGLPSERGEQAPDGARADAEHAHP